MTEFITTPFAYPQFYRDLLSINVKPISNSYLCKLVNILSQERSEHVHLIILLYSGMNISQYLDEQSENKNGIMFSVNDLPKDLLMLIGKYVMCEVISI